MYAAANPLGIGLVAAGVTTLLVTVLLTVMSRPRLRPVEEVEAHPDLPHGAEAALTSVIEAMPDPRNVLALTRDLSGEVRITDADRAGYLAMLAEEQVVERAALPESDPEPVSVVAAAPIVEPPVIEPPVIEPPAVEPEPAPLVAALPSRDEHTTETATAMVGQLIVLAERAAESRDVAPEPELVEAEVVEPEVVEPEVVEPAAAEPAGAAPEIVEPPAAELDIFDHEDVGEADRPEAAADLVLTGKLFDTGA